MYRVIFWMQGKIYKVQPDGQLAPEIIKQTQFLPFETQIIITEDEAKSKLEDLTKIITKKIVETLGVTDVGKVS